MTRSTIRMLSSALRLGLDCPLKSHQPRFAILACAAAILLLPSLAVAQITVVDPIQTFTIPTPNAAETAGTVEFPATASYTVTSSANVLVVEYDFFNNNVTGQVPTITWTPTGGSAQTLTNAIDQTETATGSYVYADVSYLTTPVAGSGTITITESAGNVGQGWALSAFGLGGVNTSAPVITSGAVGTADNFNDTANGVTAGSFAAIAADARVNASTNTTISTNGSTTTSNITNTWNQTEDSNAFQLAGGYLANLSAGSTTFTIDSNWNASAGRNLAAVAVFTPITSTALTWTGGGGSGGNGSWDTTSSTANWNLTASPFTPTAFTNGVNVTFDNTGANANITIQSAGVSPGGVIFNNTSSGATYTFSTAGSNGIGGTGTILTLNGGGTVNLNAPNTYTGGTSVNYGTLRVGNSSGSATGTGAVTVGDQVSGHTATLSGAGIITGAATINGPGANGNAATIAGASGSTLSLTGGLTLQAGSTSSFALGTPNTTSGAALIATSGVTNSLTVNGATTIGFSTPQIGTYDLFSYTGSTTFSDFTLSTASISNYPSLNFQLVNGAGQVDLLVAAPVYWTGANGGPNTPWDTTTQNWATTAGAATTYSDPNGVVFFNDTYFNGTGTVPVASGNVYIRNGGVSPSLVTFNNTAVNYSLFDSDGVNGILGSATVVKNGNGTVTFTGPNGYTGSTTLNAGTLAISNNNALGSTSGTIAPLTFSGGTLQYAPSSTNTDISGRTVTINSAGATVDLGGNAVSYANGIGNNGTGGLTLVNSNSGSPAMLTLAGASTFGNATSASATEVTIGGAAGVGGGLTLSISNNNQLGTTPTVLQPASLVINGGTLQITATTNYLVTTLPTDRGITLGANGGTINIPVLGTGSFTTNETSVSYGGVIAGTSSGNLTISGGSGTNIGTAPYLLELGATSTYSGNTTTNTTINNATVTYINTGAAITNILPASTVLNVINHGWFVLADNASTQQVAGLTGDSTSLVGSTNGGALSLLTIAPANGQSYTYAGVIGPITLLAKAGAAATTQVAIAGTGTGTEIFTGANTYGGTLNNVVYGTTVKSGILGIDSTSAIGVGLLTLNGGTIDNLTSPSTPITLSTNNVQTWGPAAAGPASGFAYGGTGSLNLGTGAVTISGDTSTAFTETLTANGSATLTVGGTVSLATTATTADTLAVSGPGVVTLNGKISNGGGTGGSLALAMNGTGTLTLTGAADNYTGGTTQTAGTLTSTVTGGFGTGNVTVNPTGLTNTAADNATLNTTGSIATTAALTVNSESSDGGFGIGTVNFNGATPQIGALNGNGSVILNNASGTALTVGNVSNNLSSNFSGTIANGAGIGSVVKTGSGSFTLGSANTYTGATSVLGGTLRVNGSLANGSAVTVGGTTAGGASGTPTLAGSGTINGPVTVVGSGAGSVAGYLAPSGFTGSSGTTLNLTNALTLNTGSVLDFNLGATTTIGMGVNDLVSITGSGAVNYGGGVVNINAYGGPLASGTYTLIQDASSVAPAGGTGWVVGTSTASNASSIAYTISLVGQNLDLTVVSTITWGGQDPVNGSAWDTITTNWYSGNSGTTFSTNANVSFNDTQYAGGPPVTNNNITIINGGVSPASVSFGNTNTPGVGVAYTINSSDSIGITGPTGITLNGTGTVTLTGTNTYTGTTFLNAGTLVIGNNNSLGSTSGTIAPITFNGGTLRYATGSTNTDISDRTVTINPAGGTIDLNGNNVTYANSIGGAGNLTLIDSGAPATLTLAGTNTYSGGTTITSGTLSVSADGNLGTVPAIAQPANITINGGTLRVTAGTAFEAATLNVGRGITLGASGGTINISAVGTGTFATNESSVSYAGVISGGAGAGNLGLTISGGSGANSGATPYLLELGGQSAYTGNTTISNATVSIFNTGGTGPSNVLPTATVLNLIDDAGFVLNNNITNQQVAGLTGDSTAFLGATNGTATNVCTLTIDPATGQSYTFAGVIGPVTLLGKTGNAATTALTINGTGTGTEILTGANTYGGATTISGGTLQIGNGGTAGTLGTGSVVDNSNLAFDRGDTGLIVGNVISGTGAVQQIGLGTTSLTATNTYTGTTTISSGTLRIGNGGSTGSLGTGTVVNNGTLVFNRTDTGLTVTGTISGGGTVQQLGTGTTTLAAGTSTYSGGTTVSAGTLVAATSAALGTGSVTLGSATLRVVGPSNTSLTGFGGNGSSFGASGTANGWTVNTTVVTTGAFPATNVLQLTDNNLSEARTAFYDTPVPYQTGAAGFSASFTYTPSGAKAADGVAFILQNDPRGAAALGGTGGAFGYTGITPSFGATLNIYPTAAGGVGIPATLSTNGTIVTNSPVTPVSLAGGDPINVSLVYSPTAQTLTETLVDSTNNNTFTDVYTGVNLSTVLAGGGSAYVGFSGGTGGAVATQQISNFSYSLTPLAVYANSVVLSAGATSTIDVAPSATNPTITMGGLTVNAGAASTLNVTASTAPSGQMYGLTLGAVTLNSNVTFNVANNTNSGNATGTLTLGAIGDNNAGYGITASGTGTVLLNSANTYLGNTVVNGTLTIGATGSIIGTGVSVSPGGILNVLSGGSISTATNLTDNGTVNFNNPTRTIATLNGASGSAALNLYGTALNVTGGGAFAGVIADGGPSGSLAVSGGTLILTGASTFSGGTTINSGTLQLGDGLTSNGSVAGNILDNAALVFANVSPQSYAGDVSGNGTLTVSGPNNLMLTGSNGYTGNTAVTGGTLTIGATGAIVGTGVAVNSGGTLSVAVGGSISTATNLTNNGTVYFNNPTRAIATLNGTNTLAMLNLNSTALTVSGGGTFAGGIADGASPGSLIVSGGTLALNGASTYSGGTTVSGGTLRVANASGTSATGTGSVAVNSGTLAGTGAANTGFLGGTVSIGSGATIAPSGASGTSATSNPVGTLTVGALTLANGAQLNYQFISPSSLDAITVSIAAAPNGTGNGTLILPSSGSATFNFYQPYSTSLATLPGGTYQLMAVGSVAGNISNLSVNAVLPMGDIPTFSTTGTALDLTISSGITTGSGTWISTGDSNYSNPANWTPVSGSNQYPNGPGQVATFGTGSEATVTLGSTYTVGGLVFDNASTSYALSGGGLMLNNNGNGPTVNVSGGAAAYISSALQLADGIGKTTTFTISGTSYLDVSGAIGETASSGQQILLAGGGTLQLDNAANTYTGGTTVSNGTLISDAGSMSATTLGSGPLVITGSTSAVNAIGGGLTVGSLSGTGNGTLNIGSSNGPTTLTVNQTTTGTFNGTLTLNGGLVLANASGNTLTINGTPSIAAGSTITVDSGTLALTNNGSAASAGAATATVASGATLQLAGSANVLSNAVNISTLGSGTSGDGALSVVGTSTQTVGVISGTAGGGAVTTYAGNTTVGDGTNAANLTATQILQNTLTINAGSMVTIAPSGSGISMDTVVANASVATSDAATSTATTDGDSSSDPFTAIQAAIASGSISAAKGQQLENRIAAIERLATTDPGLDVSLLEDRVLAALPAPSVWSSSGTDSSSGPLLNSGSGLLAVDSGTIDSAMDATSGGAALGGATAAFAPSAAFAGSPAAVPEPSTLLLAAFGAIGVLIAVRRRTTCCE